MKTHFLSRFSPSLMPPDALEAIFVQREPLLQAVIGRIRESVLSRSNQHTLLIGPRGIGKTHLISLLYYRLRAVGDLRDHMLIAWLREEEWGITTFRDFLFRLLRSLPDQEPDPTFLDGEIAALLRLPPDQIEIAATKILKKLVSRRTLLVLVENLDDLFRRLGIEGQSRLRAFMVENPFFSIVATSPTSFGDLVAPGALFSGFFQISQLRELSFEDATQLVSKIARYEGNEALAAFITTPRGRARMRALRYLAGGNHRAYVIFSQLLARESLGELIEPLMRTIDDLTPYYQSRIAVLSPDQRKIVEYVCEERHPVRVADVARDCFLAPSAAAALFDDLSQAGHLQVLSINREKFYELREPLMRLTIEVKKHRGKPIRLLLDFLRLWYSPSELKQRLSLLPADAAMEREYALPAMLITEEDWEDPRIPECSQAFNDALSKNDPAGALEAAEELTAIRGNARDLSAYASSLLRLDRFEEALAVNDRIVAQMPEDPEAWRLRGWMLQRIGRLEEALESNDKSIALDPEAARTWYHRGSILLTLGRAEEALSSCDRAIEIDSNDVPAWTTRGQALADLGCYEEAVASFANVTALDKENSLAHAYLSAALIELKRFDEGLNEAKIAVDLDLEDPVAWILQGFALAALQRNGEALDCFDRAVALGEYSSLICFRRAQILLAMDRWREGAAALDDSLAHFAHAENPDAGDTAALIRNLMSKLYGPRILQLCIETLVLLYRKHRVLSPLGRGLIECIPEITSAVSHSDAAARLWLDSWNAAASGLPEFRLPLRLLEFAIRYRETQDLRVFMEMAQEERALLEPLLGIMVQETA